MPMPESVEPIPFPSVEVRFTDPDDAQDASYLAASARMESFLRRSRTAIRRPYVLILFLSRGGSSRSRRRDGTVGSPTGFVSRDQADDPPRNAVPLRAAGGIRATTAVAAPA